MQLNPLQKFEQARALAQLKNNPAKAPASINNPSPSSSKPISIQDLIKSKQQELGIPKPIQETQNTPAPMTYGRTGKVQSTFAPAQNSPKKPLGNFLDLVG